MYVALVVRAAGLSPEMLIDRPPFCRSAFHQCGGVGPIASAKQLHYSMQPTFLKQTVVVVLNEPSVLLISRASPGKPVFFILKQIFTVK